MTTKKSVTPKSESVDPKKALKKKIIKKDISVNKNKLKPNIESKDIDSNHSFEAIKLSKSEAKPKSVKKSLKSKDEVILEQPETKISRFDIPIKFKKTDVPEFELPKFKTTEVIPYKPDYGQSILDNPNEESESTTFHRYSDAELEQFKEILQSKLDDTKSELLIVQKQLSQSGSDLDRTHSVMDDGQMNANIEQLTQIARRYALFIDNLEKALIRVENKTYGICRATGKLIDKERLCVVPHATLSLEAKMKIVKSKDN